MTSALNPRGYGTEDEYEEEVLNSLRRHLHVIVPRLAQSGSPLPAPAELADAMAAAVPGATTRSALPLPLRSAATARRPPWKRVTNAFE